MTGRMPYVRTRSQIPAWVPLDDAIDGIINDLHAARTIGDGHYAHAITNLEQVLVEMRAHAGDRRGHEMRQLGYVGAD